MPSLLEGAGSFVGEAKAFTGDLGAAGVFAKLDCVGFANEGSFPGVLGARGVCGTLEVEATGSSSVSDGGISESGDNSFSTGVFFFGEAATLTAFFLATVVLGARHRKTSKRDLHESN